MYCVDLTHDIYLNTDYRATSVDANGYILNDDPAKNPDSVALTNSIGQLTNAGNIGYLMVNFAPSAITLDQQLALQSAIWAEVYGKNYGLLQNPGFSIAENHTIVLDQASYLNQIPVSGNANYISSVIWINPSQDGVYAQGQVAYGPAVDHFNGPSGTPVPSTLVMSSVLLGIFAAVWSCKRLTRIGIAA